MLLWCQPTKTMLYFGCKVNMSFGLCKAVACGVISLWSSGALEYLLLLLCDFSIRLNISIGIGADFKSRLSMQMFVRPQELINYKIKKAINLSRFAMPILAIALKKVNT